MTTRKIDMADALEKAVRPSKELDRDIARLIGWHRVEPRHTHNKRGAWIAPDDFSGTMSGGSPILDGLHGTTMHRDVPDFTSSIDAAVTLIPAGYDWSLHVDNGNALAGCEPSSDHGCSVSDCGGATPAIAICVAAIRVIPVTISPRGK